MAKAVYYTYSSAPRTATSTNAVSPAVPTGATYKLDELSLINGIFLKKLVSSRVVLKCWRRAVTKRRKFPAAPDN